MTEGPGRVLIVTDGRDSTDDIAGEIARIVGRTASTVGAGTFGGADLLPAGVFFLGCAEPSPRAFGYLEILFAHIGLAGRSCGVFSRDAGALDYLRELVRPSEALAGRPFLAGSDGTGLRDWVREIMAGRIFDGRL